jgi:hypothetical protein
MMRAADWSWDGDLDLVDDIGSCHAGENCFCAQIGNHEFT